MLPVRVSVTALAAVLIFSALQPFARSQPGSEEVAGVPKIQFEKYALPNGLQVILHVDRKLPWCTSTAGTMWDPKMSGRVAPGSRISSNT